MKALLVMLYLKESLDYPESRGILIHELVTIHKLTRSLSNRDVARLSKSPRQFRTWLGKYASTKPYPWNKGKISRALLSEYAYELRIKSTKPLTYQVMTSRSGCSILGVDSSGTVIYK